MELESQSDQNNKCNGYLQLLPDKNASMYEETNFQSDEDREHEHENTQEEKNIIDEHQTSNMDRSSHNSGYLDPMPNGGVDSGGYLKSIESGETISDEDNNTDERRKSYRENKSGGGYIQKGIQDPLYDYSYIHNSRLIEGVQLQSTQGNVIHDPLSGRYIRPGIQNTLDGMSGDYSYIHESRLLEDQFEGTLDKDGGYEYIPGDMVGYQVDGGPWRGPMDSNNNNVASKSTTNEHDEENNTYQPLRKKDREQKKLANCFYQHKITFTIIFVTLLTCVISSAIALSVTKFFVKKEDAKSLTSKPITQISSTSSNTIYISTSTMTASRQILDQYATTVAQVHETTTKSYTTFTEQPHTTTTEYIPPPLKGKIYYVCKCNYS